ncbi:MAG: DUF4124 domain-containing protein [Nitrospirae bacterium]|nr:MAG: hypothetical protein AUI03_09235 [Nitrospirae bacterium 13_2_20CM_2_62_8]TLY39279.1 MAG: DUF4124 domain-containing protein [Nitrospirota bacterium]TLY39331.1 MAG: DUF4124 domain-containing protein [Nitrospirota bacterium]
MHSGVNTRPERTFGWPKGGVVASLLLLWFGCFMAGPIENAWAATYTYVDDKGTVVFTDNKDNIPARYRARVKVLEERESAKGGGGLIEKGATAVEQVTAKVTGKITDTASQSPITIPGLSPYQSRVLSLAFVGAVLIAGTMLLSGNPALRFLMRWLLVLLAIGTTASMYFSEGGLAQKATGTAKELERTQQQKSQQIQQMEPTEKGP